MIDRGEPDPYFVELINSIKRENLKNSGNNKEKIVDLLKKIESAVRFSSYEDSSPGMLDSESFGRPLTKLIQLCGPCSDIVKRCVNRVLNSPYDLYGYSKIDIIEAIGKHKLYNFKPVLETIVATQDNRNLEVYSAKTALERLNS